MRQNYPSSKNFNRKITFDKEAVILSGQTESNEITLEGASVVGLFVPSGFTGNYLYFYLWDGENFVQASVPDATEDLDMQLKVLPSRAFPFVPVDFAAFQKIKIVAGTAQASDITIRLICRDLA